MKKRKMTEVYIRRSNYKSDDPDDNIIVWTKVNNLLDLENFLTFFGILADIKDMVSTLKYSHSHFFVGEENPYYYKEYISCV